MTITIVAYWRTRTRTSGGTMKILVTGAAGMIGRKLATRLARDAALNGAPIDHMLLVDVVPPERPAGLLGRLRRGRRISPTKPMWRASLSAGPM
jgi:hypothetical protein